MERCKYDLEALYEDKVEGMILCATARWHEHGEKNSKYFLNLKKRNHIKKHVRKLHISGVISTDPFRIMDSQRQFYRNLYQSRNVNLNCVESSIFFNNPNLPSSTVTRFRKFSIVLPKTELFMSLKKSFSKLDFAFFRSSVLKRMNGSIQFSWVNASTRCTLVSFIPSFRYSWRLR